MAFSSRQRSPHRRNGFVGIIPIGAAAAGHVGTATAAFAANRLDRYLNQIDCAKSIKQIRCHADCNGGLTLVDTSVNNYPRTGLRLGVIDHTRQILGR